MSFPLTFLAICRTPRSHGDLRTSRL